jgi:CheY-like chemotaxis protein/signal transduction histidine kinase
VAVGQAVREGPPHADLHTQLIRVQARLERERAARRESEDIAESTLRRLYLRQVELDLLSQVTSIANSAPDYESAFRDAMVLIRNTNQWQAGHYFLPARDDPSVMVSSGVWSGEPNDSFVAELRTATSGMRFPPGVGMPGTAYLQGATWVEDIGESRNFPRQQFLQGGSAFAFPILIGDEVVAVMEFLQSTSRVPQQGLIDLSNVIGIQLGRVVERSVAREKESEYRTFLQDAVEQRTADLIAARNRAEAQSDARATLFSTVSHDLQTPLHAALSQIQAATTAKDPLEQLGQAAIHLTELEQRIKALVELAGPTDASADHPRVVDLARVLDDVVAAHDAAMRQRDAESDVIVVASASNEVLVDVDRFRRIVHTLLAGRLIEQSPGAVRIRLEVRATWADLTVEEPNPGTEGTALALTRQLAEGAGGEILVATLPEGRRRIEVRIPVAVQGRHRRGVGRRVLLVDDIAVTRQISAAMLTRIGAQVSTAENGLEALEVLRGGDFALVLMDLRMPVMGGLEAARRIRAGEAGAERSDVPVVALTAHSAAGDADRSLLAGMDAHLAKPFTFDELRSTVLLYAPGLAGDS